MKMLKLDNNPEVKEIYVTENGATNLDWQVNVIGGKTGYTKKAGRTLITVFNQNGRELVVVTMDAYNDWNLHRSLVNAYDE